MKTLEERFKNAHLLSKEEKILLYKELKRDRPDFLKPFVPKWWWWRRCVVKVLVVCDGGLNFGTGGFGLSEFLTAFNELESTTWIDYKVTLAHRNTIINSSNPVVVAHISNFTFDNSVTLNDFDQVWLFGIDSFVNISPAESTVIENYMNGGGGLFATGDHGALGGAMGANITRVKDMRHWTNTPAGATNDTNEVSMTGRRRNDTNRPGAGQTTSLFFDNQSDNIPQTIAVRTFGTGLPHPLLSIKKSLRPSGIIDIMPDHPHEGECKMETSFTVGAVTIPTQIIATSFVLGGSTVSNGFGKAQTDPHCFPSISVWDGRPAAAGRIVIDSTWHHFVNINLNGVDSDFFNPNDIPGQQSGLTPSDLRVVKQYYMNIATWMSRRKSWFCWRRWILFDLLSNSQLIEASLNNPAEKLRDISLADLNSIGALAEEILSSKYNSSFARSFMADIMEDFHKEYAKSLDIWSPLNSGNKKESADFYTDWINTDLILWTAIGSGFITLRDSFKNDAANISEKDLDKISEIFIKGMEHGFNFSLQSLNNKVNGLTKMMSMKK